MYKIKVDVKEGEIETERKNLIKVWRMDKILVWWDRIKHERMSKECIKSRFDEEYV